VVEASGTRRRWGPALGGGAGSRSTVLVLIASRRRSILTSSIQRIVYARLIRKRIGRRLAPGRATRDARGRAAGKTITISSEGSRERVLDGWSLQIRWPKRDQVTRTYVTSRRVIRTRVDVNRREFSTFGGFDPPLLHSVSPQCAKASGVMRVAGPGPTGAGPRNRSASERARAAVAGPRSQAAIPTRTTPLPIASLVGTEADVHPAVAHILTEHELRLNPNVLSVAHWSRLLGGALYAATTRVDWATLLRRSFEVDVLACARCGGRLRVLGEVTDPALVQLVLESLGLPGHAPSAARARDPTSLRGDTANV